MNEIYRELRHPWLNTHKFETVQILDLVRASLEKKRISPSTHAPPTWIIDLDSTLFCTGFRTKKIYRDFLFERGGAVSEEWTRILPHLNPWEHQYSIRQTLERALQYTNESKSSELSYKLWKNFEPFWFPRFFSNAYLQYDRPYEGIPDVLNFIAKAGLHIIYLTGRTGRDMRSGTLDAFHLHQIPMGPFTRLIMKPDQHLTDLEFKTQALKTLQHQLDVHYFLDNEPENIELFIDIWKTPEKAIFVHSIMSERIPSQQTSGIRYRLNSFI